MTPPLIFIHYSDSRYLRYTLESAVRFNPGRRIVLLGDRSNAYHRALGLEHALFSDYSSGEEIELFDSVYRHMAGERHGRREWTRFVFRRWFHIYNFLRAHNLDAFWTFDSDTLILTNLSAHESTFLQYACTEQCSGSCMNGLVSSRSMVKGYLDTINALFRNRTFLDSAESELRVNPHYAFTEMRAYIEYREAARFPHVRLDTILDGAAFVDSVCTLEEHRAILCDDNFETYPVRIAGRELKKIYLRDDGHIFMIHRPSQRLIKLNALNMSWVSDALIARLFHHAKRRLARYEPEAHKREPVLLCAEECEALGGWQSGGKPLARQRLEVTDKLREKLKAFRRRDPNVYPLY